MKKVGSIDDLYERELLIERLVDNLLSKFDGEIRNIRLISKYDRDTREELMGEVLSRIGDILF